MAWTPYEVLMGLLSSGWRFLRGLAGRPPRASVMLPDQVITHDPAASKPHDLDDPFHSPEVQENIGKIIAQTRMKKPDQEPR